MPARTRVRTLCVAAILGLLSSGLPGGRVDADTFSPVPLESPDPRLKDYLARVQARIKANWVYPCVPIPETSTCEYREVRLQVEFGILKSGDLAYARVRQPPGDGLEIYERNAIEAIQKSSPFPTIPAEAVAALNPASTGMAVVAKLNYILDKNIPLDVLRGTGPAGPASPGAPPATADRPAQRPPPASGVVDVLGGTVAVVVILHSTAPVVVRGNEGLTITGYVPGPVRPARTSTPPPTR